MAPETVPFAIDAFQRGEDKTKQVKGNSRTPAQRRKYKPNLARIAKEIDDRQRGDDDQIDAKMRHKTAPFAAGYVHSPPIIEL